MRIGAHLLVALAFGCSASRDAILNDVTPPDGQYTIRYLDPPWTLIASEGSRIDLEVPANHREFLAPGEALPPKIALAVTTGIGRAEERARAEESAAETVVHSVASLQTRAGELAWSLTYRQADEGRFVRLAFLDDSVRTGTTIEMQFDSDEDLANREIDAMVGDARVRPETE